MNDVKENMKINLFPGEKFPEIPEQKNGNSEYSDQEINNKYLRGETRIITEQARYPLNTIVDLVKSENYILNPEYQRRHRWSVEKKSKLIESFIINVPIPPIFLYETDFSVYEVMDGLQRLTTISDFYQNKFRLQGLQEWAELNNKTYEELPENVRKGIDRRYLSSIILLQETAKDDKIKEETLKQLVFERLNSGGEKLTPQETRNALYSGKLNQLCIKLARNEYFCKLWRIPVPTKAEKESGKLTDELINNKLFKEMDDAELVLRFFAYRQIEKTDDYPSLEKFLDEYLKHGNSFSNELLEELEHIFEETIELVYLLLGENAFVLQKKKTKKSPTKVLYDPIMYVLSKFIDHKEELLHKKEEIHQDLSQLYAEDERRFEGRYNTKNDIIKRRDILTPFFEKYLTKQK